MESLSLDSETVRIALASPFTTPNSSKDSVPLMHLLDFVEKACPPWYWASCAESDKERERWNKMLSVCKAAVIKAVVTVAGEDKNLKILWDSAAKECPGGWFVERMVTWLKNEKVDGSNGRDDLIICASLSLGNLGRNGESCSSHARVNTEPLCRTKLRCSPLPTYKPYHTSSTPHRPQSRHQDKTRVYGIAQTSGSATSKQRCTGKGRPDRSSFPKRYLEA
jgi:hypothetical protein